MKSKQDIAELEFLSILYSKTNIAMDLLQIKPKYMLNQVHQKIFELILKSQKDLGVVDDSFITDKLQTHELIEMTEIISEEYLPFESIKKHFMSAQTVILDNYKRKVIKDITTKFNSRLITVDEYLKKMEKIQNIQIQDKGIYLTEEEITTSINVEKVRIPLKRFGQLDKILELVQNDFLVIGANTGTGKSSLLLNLMNDLMEDYQCIYFNLEMSKSTLYKRMIAIQANVSVNAVTSPSTEYQANNIKNAIKYITNHDVCVEHRLSDLEDIEFYIKMMKNEKGKHTIVFLDHLGLIRTKNSKSLYEKITEIAKSLRQICLKYDCTIISACQLNRSSYGSEKLDLSMLKDSGEIENSASKIILLYRNKEYSSDCLEPEMMLNICKNRDGMLGETSLIYEKVKQTFREKIRGAE